MANSAMENMGMLLLDLPDVVLLEIVSYLPVQDMLSLSDTCQRLNAIVYDEFQWFRKLRVDKHVLYVRSDEDLDSLVSRVEHFETFVQNVVSDPDQECFKLYQKYISKENRLKSSATLEPEASTSVSQRLVTLMGSLFRAKPQESAPPIQSTPVVTMFGPGLESVSTKSIASKILNSRSNQLYASAMNLRNQSTQNSSILKTGNQVNLAGGGIIVKFYGTHLRFVTLYSNTRLKREGLSSRDRLQNSKLFEEDSNGQFKIIRGIQSVCETTEAFIYVIDISQDVNMDAELFFDLHAFAEHNHKAPLLILACVPNSSTPRHRWSTLLREIKLHSYEQPWQVSLINVETLSNLDTALDWIVAHTASQ